MANDDIREGDPDEPRKKKRRPVDADDGDGEAPERRSNRRKGSDDGGVGVVIPYRNGMALTAYYTGIFGLITCFLGLGILGLIPLILGVLGLMKARKDPEARGTAHAWVGIILGAIEILSTCGLIGFFVFTAVTTK